MKDLPGPQALHSVLWALPALAMAGAIFYVSSLSKIDLPLDQLSFLARPRYGIKVVPQRRF